MALFFFIMLLCTTDPTQGAGCEEGQHCSDCDMNGVCLQDCDKGFYGLTCRSQCSSTCRYNTCKLVPGKGTYTCTHGCVPGYQGVRCERPCVSHVVNCTLCPGGCDREYCQLRDACFAGCADSRYGSGCKTCPSNCRTCNRMIGICDECDATHHGVNCEMTCPSNCRTCNRTTGVCDECDPTHHGVNCEMTCPSNCRTCNRMTEVCDECDATHHGVNCEKTCENCAGSCESGCGCVPGFYGDFCAETCSKTCRPKSAHKCLPAVTSDSCTGECDKLSATCLHGCVDGWFGPMCSSPCNPGCRHQRCNAAGSCANGCEPHHFGSACEPCSENCANRTCDQTTGACVTDCSEEGSEPNCTQTCFTPGCSSANPLPEVPHMSSATLIWIVCTAVLFVLVTSSVCCVCFRKGPCVQRNGVHGMKSMCFREMTEANRDGVQMRLGTPRICSDDYCDVNEGEGGPVIVYL